jgi:amino acid transporter
MSFTPTDLDRTALLPPAQRSASQPDTAIPIGHHRALRRNYLSLLEVVAQSVATVAPSGTPALVIPVVFGAALNGTWLAYLFATVALLLVSYNINQFATKSASPGALYVFAGQGLGALLGVIAGWSLIIAYLFTAAAVISGSVNYALVLLGDVNATDGGRPLLIGLATIVVLGAWALAYRDIKLSTRVMLVIEFSTIALILVLLAVYFGTTGNWLDQAQIQLREVTPEHLRLGLVLAFFSFVGFESAAALGHEAKEPLRTIPRAILSSVIGIGVFFVIASYGLVGAFQGAVPGLGSDPAPLSTLATRFHLDALGPIIAAGVSLSFFACTLASINAGARVLYAMSRHGLFHDAAGSAHQHHATPHVAVTLTAVLALILSLAITATGAGPLDNFSYLGTIATFGFIFAYILVSIAVAAFLKRQGQLRVRHLLVAIASVLLLLLPLIGSLYPVPPAPFDILPYVFFGLLALGVVYFLALRMLAPQRVAAIDQDLRDLGS